MEGQKSEFYQVQTSSGDALVWNIYQGCCGGGESYDSRRTCDYVKHTLQRYCDVAVDRRPDEWRQSFFSGSSMQTGAGTYRKTKWLTFSNVPLADGTTCKRGTFVLILTPLMDLENAYQLPSTSSTLPTTEEPDDDNEDDDVDGDVDRHFGISAAAERPTKQRNLGGGIARGRKNNKATLIVRAHAQERFPGLDAAIRIFRDVIFAIDLYTKLTIREDKKSRPEVEFMATYRTHIEKGDKHTQIAERGVKRYTQTIEELEKNFFDNNNFDGVGDCNIRFSNVKGWYMSQCNSGASGVWRSEEPQYCKHQFPELPFGSLSGSEELKPSDLSELERCRTTTGCHVQLLFHLGLFYEFQEGTDKISRGCTLEVHSLCFWPHPTTGSTTRLSTNSGAAAVVRARDDVASNWDMGLAQKLMRQAELKKK